MKNVNVITAMAREEAFGQALSVIKFKTIEEAIELANNACYGRSPGVWSDDFGTCLRIAGSAQADAVRTNMFMDGPDAMPGIRPEAMTDELGTDRSSPKPNSASDRKGMPHTPDIVIIGSGMGGATLAAGLAPLLRCG